MNEGTSDQILKEARIPGLAGLSRYFKGFGKDVGHLKNLVAPTKRGINGMPRLNAWRGAKDLNLTRYSGPSFMERLRKVFTPNRRMSKINPVRFLNPNRYSQTNKMRHILKPLHYGLGSAWKSPVGRVAGLAGTEYLLNKGYEGLKGLPSGIARELQETTGISDHYRDNISDTISDRWPELLGQAVDPRVYFSDTDSNKAKRRQNELLYRLTLNSLKDKKDPLDMSSPAQYLRGPWGESVLDAASTGGNWLLDQTDGAVTPADVNEIVSYINKSRKTGLKGLLSEAETPLVSAFSDASIRTLSAGNPVYRDPRRLAPSSTLVTAGDEIASAARDRDLSRIQSFPRHTPKSGIGPAPSGQWHFGN